MNKRVGAVLAGLLLVAIATGAGYALFSMTVRSGTSRLEAGKVEIALHGDAVSLAGIKPGDGGDAIFTVTNTGTLPVVYTFEVETAGELFEGINPVVIYTPAIPTSPYLNVGSSSEIFLGWYMPEDAGNEYQGAAGEFTVVVTATQAIEAYP